MVVMIASPCGLSSFHISKSHISKFHAKVAIPIRRKLSEPPAAAIVIPAQAGMTTEHKPKHAGI
jgi:hypothetical protein